MLKISKVEPLNHEVTLRLEGRVVGAWVDELRETCREVITEGRPLKLDVGEVSFLDRTGIALFGELKTQGVRFLNCSPFVAEELKTLQDDEVPGDKCKPGT